MFINQKSEASPMRLSYSQMPELQILSDRKA